jgi:hypothetical protein
MSASPETSSNRPITMSAVDAPPVNGRLSPLTFFTTVVAVTTAPPTVVVVGPWLVDVVGCVVDVVVEVEVDDVDVEVDVDDVLVDEVLVELVDDVDVELVDVEVDDVDVDDVDVDDDVVDGGTTDPQNCRLEMSGRLPCPTGGSPRFENVPKVCGGS